MYIAEHDMFYYSRRYKKGVTIPPGFVSDGATFAPDIDSKGWWFHDWLKDIKQWDDGSYCSNWQASWVLSDILREEGRYIRSVTWFLATLIYGEVKKLWAS